MMINKDQYEKLECQTPMASTEIKVFEYKVMQAVDNCGGRDAGFVTIEALQDQFKTPAW